MPDSKHPLIMPEPDLIARDSHRGHPLPRRTSPANSVTLKHHRLARDASLRASAGSGRAINASSNSNSNSNSPPRRNSSGESHDTGRSDPRKWFDQSNQNPTATFDNNVMEVDPPFFQKESDSSNEDRPFQFQQQTSVPRLPAQSSSADDYRSVIDDLTVEIQKLKEELKRYKQKGPDLLRKEKLFEIKIHGLPKRKKRELETTLRDFAASLDGSPDASSSQAQRKGRHANRDNMYGGSGSMSKHASSSSGSNPRPVDSAYASMSTGANSSGTSLGRPSMSLRSRSSNQKVQNYLRDIPEGLYPRQTVMSEKDRKKLVVRRLEHLFTGKITGRGFRRILTPPPPGSSTVPNNANPSNESGELGALAPVTIDVQGQQQSTVHQPPSLMVAEASREARILPTEQQGGRKKSRSRDNGSASNSNGEQMEGNSSGGTNTSPAQPVAPEQRPTRPKDLDPDRVQVPSENMDYIRHLGLVPPELLADAVRPSEDVHPDAEGWVYLNLLCNLAQLHMVNVTPSFVRAAVSELSTKFQLSPDGRKIRWRGGSEGTRFSSESSGNISQASMETEDTDASNKNKGRKRQKTKSTGGDLQSGGSSSKNPSKFGPQISGSSESFHYKPLFVQQDSQLGNSSPEDTLSSFGPIEDSQVGESGWGQSGSGTSNRRKRRHDGAIIYYSGAPFCTDLSGDTGDVSPTTYMMSSGQAQQEEAMVFERPMPFRSASGSSLEYRPLSDYPQGLTSAEKMDVDAADPGLTTDTGDEASEIDFEMPWTDYQQYIEVRPLEPCGLGGVLPDDHFMVVVTTARPKTDSTGAPKDYFHRASTEEATDGIISRLATMSTSSPQPLTTGSTPGTSRLTKGDVEIHYMSGRIKRLAPVPLPPPAIFFPPFSTNTSSSGEEGMSIDIDDESSSIEELVSRQAEPHQSDGYPDGVDLSSGDEDGEDPDDEPDAQKMYDIGVVDEADEDDETKSGSVQAAAGTASRGRSKSVIHGGSSAATAGGVGSGFASSDENVE